MLWQWWWWLNNINRVDEAYYIIKGYTVRQFPSSYDMSSLGLACEKRTFLGKMACEDT